MAPPTESFSPEELPYRMQLTEDGRLRKSRQKLEECQLMRMISYSCDVGRDANGHRIIGGTVWCYQFPRLFRRCADGLTVETTSWEKVKLEGTWEEGVMWDKKQGGLVRMPKN